MSNQHARWLELTQGMSNDEREDLAARLRNMQPAVNFCTVLTFLAFLFGCHAVLLQLSRSLASAPAASITVLYQPAIWWGFPAIGGFTMAWEITLRIWSLAGHRTTANRYRELAKTFIGSYRGRAGAYNVQTFMRWSALLLALPAGVWSVLALNMHTTFEPAGLRECGYLFRPCALHAWSGLRQIDHVAGRIGSNGKYIPGPDVVLHFADGYKWDSSEWDPDPQTIGAIEHFTTEKTGLPLGHLGIEYYLPESKGR